MTRLVVQLPAADLDLEEITAGFGETSETLSDRFLDSAAEDLGQLSRMPGLGAKVEVRAATLAGLRCFRVPNFKSYLIFYRYDDDKVEVVRVLHGARDIEAILGELD